MGDLEDVDLERMVNLKIGYLNMDMYVIFFKIKIQSESSAGSVCM